MGSGSRSRGAIILGGWGFVNKSGNCIVKPQLLPAWPFNEGLAQAKAGGGWGYVDQSGNWTIEPRFAASAPFHEGVASVKLGDQWGCIDKTGAWVIPPQFAEMPWIFQEGIAAIRVQGKYGFIDRTGKLVVEPKFDTIGAFGFSEGLVTAARIVADRRPRCGMWTEAVSGSFNRSTPSVQTFRRDSHALIRPATATRDSLTKRASGSSHRSSDRRGRIKYHKGMAARDPTSNTVTQIPEQDIRDIVRRIVQAADPERILLFGSAARGAMGPNSDLDLLVIKGGDYDRSAAERDIYRSLRDIKYAKDVVLVTPDEVEKYRDCFAVVICPALRDGKVVYDRSAL